MLHGVAGARSSSSRSCPFVGLVARRRGDSGSASGYHYSCAPCSDVREEIPYARQPVLDVRSQYDRQVLFFYALNVCPGHLFWVMTIATRVEATVIRALGPAVHKQPNALNATQASTAIQTLLTRSACLAQRVDQDRYGLGCASRVRTQFVRIVGQDKLPCQAKSAPRAKLGPT